LYIFYSNLKFLLSNNSFHVLFFSFYHSFNSSQNIRKMKFNSPHYITLHISPCLSSYHTTYHHLTSTSHPPSTHITSTQTFNVQVYDLFHNQCEQNICQLRAILRLSSVMIQQCHVILSQSYSVPQQCQFAPKSHLKKNML
jgi:hypothetical protein